MATKKQKKLLLLAALALIEQKDKIVRMDSYRGRDGSNYYDFIDQTKKRTPCGSVGCFLGWCPFLGIRGLGLNDRDYRTYLEKYDFELYCERVFGIRYFEHFDSNFIGISSNSWVWLFGPDWENQKTGILRMVKYFVVHGHAPEWFNRESDYGRYGGYPKGFKAPSLAEAKKAVGLD